VSTPPRRRPGIVVLALVVGFLGGVGGAIVAGELDLGSSSGSSNAPVQLSEVDADDPSIGDTVIAQVANVLADSVVTISSVVDDGFESGEATGTGVVLTADGEILTNAHVVDGASEVRVRFAGETEPRTAEVIASEIGNDLALLKIDATGLKPVTFAQPDTVRVGDTVVAIGYALALDGGPTVTSGIISALKRTIVTDSGALNGLIQTDAPISSGNSGGPLVNLRGEVVGITIPLEVDPSLGVEGSSLQDECSYALPSKIFTGLYESIREARSFKSPWFGFAVMSRAEIAKAKGFEAFQKMNKPKTGGILIESIFTPSPAAAAGVQPGDFLVKFDGKEITAPVEFQRALYLSGIGHEATLEFFRDGVTLIKKIKIEQRPAEAKSR